MSPKFLILVSIFWHSLLFVGCESPPLVSPEAAQRIVREAWQANAHIIWELEAESIPLDGPITVAVWQAEERYRYELLEAPSAAMVGDPLIVNGADVWQYNRFRDAEPRHAEIAHLAPFTEVAAQIDALLAQKPQELTATRDTFEQRDGFTAEIYALRYPNGDSLSMWRDLDTGLPFRIEATIDGNDIALRARRFEPLSDPSAGLFAPMN